MDNLLLEVLKDVLDPEFGISVVDLGLIYGIEARPDEVVVTMTLTSPHCPLHETIIGGVEQALAIATRKKVRVEMVWEPAWTPERISPYGQRLLAG